MLGWPGTSVIQGKRFDLILRDDSGLPIITIETKTPYHKASTKERRDFEKRLAAFPTLRYAIFTSGNDWQPTPKGSYQITEQSLKELPIAPPSNKKVVLRMLNLAKQIIEADEPFAADRLKELETEINGIVLGLLKRST